MCHEMGAKLVTDALKRNVMVCSQSIGVQALNGRPALDQTPRQTNSIFPVVTLCSLVLVALVDVVVDLVLPDVVHDVQSFMKD